MPTSNNVILGIDPGLARVGYGIIKNNLEVLSYGVIETKKGPTPERLLKIKQELKKIIKKYRPNQAAVEELFFYKNVKTAFAVGEARGAIILSLVEEKISISEYTPLEVKQTITGYGQADKQQMQKMIQIILKLKEIPKPDDAADGLALALTCLYNQKRYV